MLGGKATAENGACLCRKCHDWLEQLSAKEREIVNEELRQYKKNFTLNVYEITTEEVKQKQIIEPEEREEIIRIPVYDTTEQEYEEYLQQRRKRELEKPRWKVRDEER